MRRVKADITIDLRATIAAPALAESPNRGTLDYPRRLQLMHRGRGWWWAMPFLIIVIILRGGDTLSAKFVLLDLQR